MAQLCGLYLTGLVHKEPKRKVVEGIVVGRANHHLAQPDPGGTG